MLVSTALVMAIVMQQTRAQEEKKEVLGDPEKNLRLIMKDGTVYKNTL